MTGNSGSWWFSVGRRIKWWMFSQGGSEVCSYVVVHLVVLSYSLVSGESLFLDSSISSSSGWISVYVCVLGSKFSSKSVSILIILVLLVCLPTESSIDSQELWILVLICC